MPEDRIQSRDKRDLSDRGSTEVERLQKVAEGDMRVGSKKES
jgi:hypothetical protein